MADPAQDESFDLAAEMPDESRLVTEDDTPLDSIYQEKQQRLLTAPLHDSWPGSVGASATPRPYVAMANVGLFHKEEPAIVPDMLLSLDVSLPADPAPKKARSYFLWRYGKPPEVVVEIVSNREGRELGDKKAIYQRMRVIWYVVFDPLACLGDVSLRCFELREGEYVERLDGRFAKLGLSLVEWEGRFEDMEAKWLRWADLDGALIPTGRERAEQEKQRAEHEKQRAEQEKQRAEHEKQRAEQEKQRADQEKQRAEQEKQRAEQERQRAERLAARLRELGVDPDEPR